MRLTLGNPAGFAIEVAAIGASWLSCWLPVGGERRELLLAPADPEAHARSPGCAYIGSTVGRVANRIAGARFTLEGRRWPLVANEGAHQLHGGPDGFHARTWRLEASSADEAVFVLHSPAGDQGYPGALTAQVHYRVDVAACSVHIAFSAEADAPTPVALTSHAYFNLDGDAADVRRHRLRVAAAQVLPVDATMIPLAEALPVAGTPFDLRTPRPLPTDPALHPQLALARGLDHCYRLDPACAALQAPAAELGSADGRVRLVLATDYPGLQVYSGQHLSGHAGRDGRPLAAFAGLALEPQALPDAINRPGWADDGLVLRPGQRWQRQIRYRFEALD